VVTHAVASLSLCDAVVFLAPGGKLTYAGPPSDALDWFGTTDYPDIFLELEANGDAWAERFATSGGWEHNPLNPAAVPADREAGDAAVDGEVAPTPVRPATNGFWGQLTTLSRRTADVLTASKGQFRLLLLQAPVIAA